MFNATNIVSGYRVPYYCRHMYLIFHTGTMFKHSRKKWTRARHSHSVNEKPYSLQIKPRKHRLLHSRQCWKVKVTIWINQIYIWPCMTSRQMLRMTDIIRRSLYRLSATQQRLRWPETFPATVLRLRGSLNLDSLWYCAPTLFRSSPSSLFDVYVFSSSLRFKLANHWFVVFSFHSQLLLLGCPVAAVEQT